MPTRHLQRALPGRLIETLEQRRLLSGAVQTVPTTGTIVGWVGDDDGHDFALSDIEDSPAVGVKVFIDANRNGKLDAANGSEPAELSVVTDSWGSFEFDNLPPGAYSVREIPPKGFRPFTPAFFDVAVSAGASVGAGDFLNTDYAVVDGTRRADRIRIEKVASGLSVTINNRTPQIFKHVAGVVIRSGAGDDRVAVSAQTLLPTWIDGGDGADALHGGGSSNTIFGGAGPDSITGGAAADSIDGGDGNDLIHCDNGNDFILGSAGNDEIYGGGGSDTIEGDEGNDLIHGDDGNDSIQGSRGNDQIYGDDGADQIYDDDDYYNPGNDSIDAGDGNDQINSWYGTDVLKGGIGNDQFDVSTTVLSLDGGVGRDTLTSSYYDDPLPSNILRIEISSTPPSPPPGSGGGSSGCFLTTAVVGWSGGVDDGPELTLLRRFRDTYMRGLADGPDMIRDYHLYAPRIVRAIENNGLGALEWPCVLAMVHAAIGHIRAGRNAAALRVYAAEYLRLKARYGQPSGGGTERRRPRKRAAVLRSC